MRFINIKKFAELKKCSRETIYNAAKRGEVEIDRSSGTPLIFLTEENMNWKPGQNIGRPRAKYVEITSAEIKKENARRK